MRQSRALVAAILMPVLLVTQLSLSALHAWEPLTPVARANDCVPTAAVFNNAVANGWLRVTVDAFNSRFIVRNLGVNCTFDLEVQDFADYGTGNSADQTLFSRQTVTVGSAKQDYIFPVANPSCAHQMDLAVPFSGYVAGTLVNSSVFSNVPNCSKADVYLNDTSSLCAEYSVPTTVTPGQTFTGRMIMRNFGKAIWTPNGALGQQGFSLIYQNPEVTPWGIDRIQLAGPVAPGADAVFTYTATAPTTPGQFLFTWRMSRGNEVFGRVCGDRRVVVQAAARPACTPADVTVANWKHWKDLGLLQVQFDLTGSRVLVTDKGIPCSHFPFNVASYKMFAPLSQNVPQEFHWLSPEYFLDSAGQQVVVPVTNPSCAFQMDVALHDPTLPGDFDFADGAVVDDTAFPVGSPHIPYCTQAPAPTNDNAVCALVNTPDTVQVGQAFTSLLRESNTGNTTWIAGGPSSGNYLAGGDNSVWGSNRLQFSHNIVPGDSENLTYYATAPATPGAQAGSSR